MTLSTTAPCTDVILIHGLYQNSLVMKILGKRLKKMGYQVHYFDYPTLKKALSNNVDLLTIYLEQFSEPFSIIAHSLGCILTLHALKKTTFPQLQSVIAITPPFHGSRIVKYLSDHYGSFLIGKSEEALTPNDNQLWDIPLPLGVIAGTQNYGPTSLLLEKLTNTVEKNSLLSDGTVYLDETEIIGSTDTTTLHKSHTMILFDPQLPILCDHFIHHHRFNVPEAKLN
ncbi:MAG TPA: alpha/beta hydrolase [Candidatus Ignatzschineria merdigallinarum]|uniref:Alpha/beta hydrolase n=1 Tax=Candidatus Ignatzschineria merdigallinarum TaxID=2838621 RepID=A0A9D1Q3W9_9GAMM|nr:alpha/beta hydrolase [Candidatus Ignatzschineria merdigallinarum]